MFYAYLRVSTESQAEKGGGLETQRQNIESYCRTHGITLAQTFTDAGISGAVKDTEDDEAISKRPALVEMLSMLQDGDSVIVMNTSRLWRSDTAKVIIRRELMKHHAKVISIENERFDLYAQNPNDRFMDGIMELMDEWERLTIALKLAKGRTAKARTGWKPAGCTPYGYRFAQDGKQVEVDPQEAPTVKKMFSMAQAGKSLKQIADTLNGDGIQTRRGNSWAAGSVQAILRNDFYTGALTHQGKTVQGNHAPLISRVQFGKVGAALERKHR